MRKRKYILPISLLLLIFLLSTAHATGNISGNVYIDGHPESPISGLTIYAVPDYSTTGETSYDTMDTSYTETPYTMSAQTNADGSYQISGLVPYGYKVYAETSGTPYVTEYYNDKADSYSADTVTVNALQTTEGIDFGLSTILGPTLGSIGGNVTEQSTGKPIANLAVELYRYGNLIESVVAESDGTYLFGDLSPDTYTVKVNTTGTFFIYAATSLSVTSGEHLSDINFELQMGGIISGVVTHADTGNTMPGQKVYATIAGPGLTAVAYDTASDLEYLTSVTKTGDISTTSYELTSPDGSYTIGPILPGNYMVYISSDGYFDQYFDKTKISNAYTPVSVTAGQMVSEIDFELSPCGKITGTVTQEEDAHPIRIMQMRLYDHNRHNIANDDTDQNGEFIFSKLPEGQYFIESGWGGYVSDTDYQQFDEEYFDNQTKDTATPIVVPKGGAVPDINFSLTKRISFPIANTGSGIIEGTVTQASNGNPVSGLQVYIADAINAPNYYNQGERTDHNGKYRITGLTPGSYIIQAGRKYSDVINIEVNQSVSNVDFIIEIAIKGKVVSQDDGNPLDFASITVYDHSNNMWMEGSQANMEGEYLICGIPAGTYVLEASSFYSYAPEFYKDKYSFSTADPVIVEAGKTKTGIDFDLAAYGEIQGTVYDADDSRVVGTFSLDNLPPGNYKVAIYTNTSGSSYAGSYYNGTLDISNASIVGLSSAEVKENIDFYLEQGTQISGKVLPLDNSSIISEIQVYAENITTGWLNSAYTKSDGSYAIRGLPDGEYKIFVTETANLAGGYFENTDNGTSTVAITLTGDSTFSSIDFQMKVQSPVNNNDGINDNTGAHTDNSTNDSSDGTDATPQTGQSGEVPDNSNLDNQDKQVQDKADNSEGGGCFISLAL